MKPFHLHHGDCLEVLRSLPAKSVDSLITDPPAGISFMGKDWDSNKGGSREWVNWLTEVLKECRRVLKPGAHGFIWALPRTSHWTATAAEWAGLEIRDVVTHLFGSGFPKSLDISKAIDKAAGAERPIIGKNPAKRPRAYEGANGWQTPDRPEFKTGPASPDAAKWAGWGTGLKPASEHWIMVRRPIVKKSVAQNILKWGTGGINVDASRIGTEVITQTRTPMRTWRASEGRTDIPASADNQQTRTQGRFPANLVLDEEAARMLDRQSGALCGGGPRTGKNNVNSLGERVYGKYAYTGGTTPARNTGGASRFFYTAKAGAWEKNAGLTGTPEKPVHRYGGGIGEGKTPEAPALERNIHPTVKPFSLMRYLITMITPPGGTVLDPFLGSGTTGAVAVACGFKFIGIEKEREYFEIAEKRIGDVKLKPGNGPMPLVKEKPVNTEKKKRKPITFDSLVAR